MPVVCRPRTLGWGYGWWRWIGRSQREMDTAVDPAVDPAVDLAVDLAVDPDPAVGLAGHLAQPS